MARVYKFQNLEKTIDVDIVVDAIGDVKHFLIVDVQDLQRSEVILGFDLSRDGYYYEQEFIDYATEKGYNLYRWDNQSYSGQIHSAITWQVTTSVQGNGTITPPSGNYDAGTEITFEAIPNEETQFDKFTRNGVDLLTNPYSEVVSEDVNMVAYFSALLQLVQDIFTTAPIQIGKNWAFENQANLPSLKNYNLIFGIDSLTVSVLCTSELNYPQEVANVLNTNTDFDFKFKNSGIGGENLIDYNADFYDNIEAYNSDNRLNLIVLFGFVNSGGYTAQELNDALESICDKAHTLGMLTLVMTSPGNSDSIAQSKVQAANTILRNNNSYSDYFLDAGANSDLYDLGGGTLTCDGSHLTNDGKNILISLVSNYIQSDILPNFEDKGSVNVLKTKHFKISNTNESAFAIKTPSLNFGLNDWSIYARVKISVDGTKIIVDRGSTNNWEVILYANQLAITINGSLKNTTIFGDSTIGRVVDLCIRRNGGVLEYVIDGIRLYDKGTITGIDLTSTDNIILPAYNITPTYNAVEYYDLMIFNNRKLTDAEVYRLYLNEPIDLTNCVLRPDFSFGLGSILYDKSPEGNNMTVVSSTPDAMFIDSDDKPTYYTKGGTLFTRDSDDKYAIATYKNDGTPNVSAISGMTKADDFPAGSGIIKGLSNTYLGILNNPTVEQDYEILNAIPESSTFIPTKIANTISQLIIKE